MKNYGDICDGCQHKDYCDMAQFGGHNPRITACSKFVKAKQTNADKIRAMTDEELAKWHERHCPEHKHCRPHEGVCWKCWLDWLKQEVESDV